MNSLEKLQKLLDFKISDGKYKMPVLINDDNKNTLNCIFLFYGIDNDILKLGLHSIGGYFSNEIQIATRHNDYNKARNICYDIIKYIKVNRKYYSGRIFIPTEPPFYNGVDDTTGAYFWSFNIKIKGGE